ncbi:MAG: hypothetical protein IPI31_02615 [Bacteroidetes bacterium]|nr:hypothetical protein [Bacteroidota bacterium]MBK7566696.1 hypothetical protein [Bacteroidota bacterium]
MDSNLTLIQLGILLVVLIALFLIGREISLWYFKINDLIELLKSNNQLLTEIRDFLKPKETGIKGIEKTYDNIKGEGDLNDPEVLEGLMKRVKTKE